MMPTLTHSPRCRKNGNTVRISNLRGGGGVNGSVVLVKGSTVFDDNATDSLTGDKGRDWFFRRSNGKDTARDLVLDTLIGEEVDTF